MFFSRLGRQEKTRNLSDLKSEVFEITKRQNQVTHWELSQTTERLVYNELQAQKGELLKAMHQKVDEL